MTKEEDSSDTEILGAGEWILVQKIWDDDRIHHD
jgi:hypothetical protein